MLRVHHPLLGLACAIGLSVGCANDTVTPPNGAYRIVGLVSDEGGLPLSRAFINIDYVLLENGGRRPRTQVHYDVVDPEASIRVEVFDAGGRAVRLLVDGEQPVGSHSVTWDGRDRDGDLVPENLYSARVSIDGDMVNSTDLFIERVTIADRARTYQVLTDALGRFELAIDSLPLGHVLVGGPEGAPITSVHTQINLYAFRGGSTRHDLVTLDLRDVRADIEVELVVPYD